MKKFLLASAALATLGMATSASAADLAARTYTKAPPMIAAMYDWSGFYIGANAGYGTERKCWDFVAVGVGTAAEGCHTADGAVVGGQVGYRWQSAAWVFGLEAQGDWANLKGSNVSTLLNTTTNRTKTDALGLFTGQVGYAWNNSLLYVKGGAAVASNKYDTFFTAGGAATGLSARDTRWGASAGVGLEYGFTPNWSVGVEYNHVFLGTTTVAYPTPGLSERIRGDIDLVTAKINYKWGGPVVAKY